MEEETEEVVDTRTDEEKVKEALQKGQQVTFHGVVANKPGGFWTYFRIPGHSFDLRNERVAEMLEEGTLVPGRPEPLKQYEKVYIKGLPRKAENRVMVMEPETEDGMVLIHQAGQGALILRPASDFVR